MSNNSRRYREPAHTRRNPPPAIFVPKSEDWTEEDEWEQAWADYDYEDPWSED